ncbi:hypothetical protein GCM10009745_65240 [Kribbella yunnanensis]|uniref:Methyltransferase domain-containing protein n=1 Tax=Kribbella yunnanensis TaxID=190194 RepID=A0ABN2INQ5_9ACTN
MRPRRICPVGFTRSLRPTGQLNAIHGDRPGQPAAFFAAGGSALGADEIATAGDVTGRRILQLACSCGDTALSWANLGASVTGVDISEVAIDLARTKSTESPVPDMHDGPGAPAAHLPATYLIRATRNVSRGTTPRVIK